MRFIDLPYLMAPVGFVGMVVLFVALMFVRDPKRFRKMIAAGLLMVAATLFVSLWVFATCCPTAY